MIIFSMEIDNIKDPYQCGVNAVERVAEASQCICEIPKEGEWRKPNDQSFIDSVKEKELEYGEWPGCIYEYSQWNFFENEACQIAYKNFTQVVRLRLILSRLGATEGEKTALSIKFEPGPYSCSMSDFMAYARGALHKYRGYNIDWCKILLQKGASDVELVEVLEIAIACEHLFAPNSSCEESLATLLSVVKKEKKCYCAELKYRFKDHKSED